MKKLGFLFALVLTFALTGHAFAQKDGGKMAPGKMPGDKMAPGKMAPGKMAPAATQSFTGPVKGDPSGRMFTLGLKKGPVSVDATKATIRVNGRFAKMEAIKGGTMVTVVGKMAGTTFMATTVTAKITPAGGKMAPTGGKMGGDKPKM